MKDKEPQPSKKIKKAIDEICARKILSCSPQYLISLWRNFYKKSRCAGANDKDARAGADQYILLLGGVGESVRAGHIY